MKTSGPALTYLLVSDSSRPLKQGLFLTCIMPFKSTEPDIQLPTNISIWDWLFDSPSSILNGRPAHQLRGYSNGITGERIDYLEVRDVTTLISTALVKRYGLQEGQTVAIFSPNTIWYPVAMVYPQNMNYVSFSLIIRRCSWQH